MSSRSQRRVTSADVAREAGLSRATVGYVLNAVPHQKIPEPTRQRVFDAAAKLGYTPSAAARSLRTGRSDVVLCLMPDWPVGSSVVALLEAISGLLEAHGYTFVTHPRSSSTRSRAEIWKAITPAVVLILEDLPAAERSALEAAGIRVVNTDEPADGSGVPELRLAGERIGRLQVEHLAARGVRRLAVGRPDDARLRVFAEPRLLGARLTCADLGLDEPVVTELATTVEGAAAAVRSWRDAGVQGVCCYNDDMAIAVIGAAARLGVAVPGELAVVGVDDAPAGRLVHPSVTTVASAFDQLAQRVADRLVDGPPAAHPTSNSYTLIARESA